MNQPLANKLQDAYGIMQESMAYLVDQEMFHINETDHDLIEYVNQAAFFTQLAWEKSVEIGLDYD